MGLGIEDLYRIIEEGRPAFWDRAKCLAAHPSKFFIDKGGQAYVQAAAAKDICNGRDKVGEDADGKPIYGPVCPVRRECLYYALSRGERFGIWGGMSYRERQAVLPHYIEAGIITPHNRPKSLEEQGAFVHAEEEEEPPEEIAI